MVTMPHSEPIFMMFLVLTKCSLSFEGLQEMDLEDN
jgi:hypothetical protein